MIERPEASLILQMILDRLESIYIWGVTEPSRFDLLEKPVGDFDEDPEIDLLQNLGKKIIEEYALGEIHE